MRNKRDAFLSIICYNHVVEQGIERVAQLGSCLSVTILALGLFGIGSVRESLAISLPYDNTCPIIYDNDDADDMYTDEYLLSLVSAGNITLKGMITSSGG